MKWMSSYLDGFAWKCCAMKRLYYFQVIILNGGFHSFSCSLSVYTFSFPFLKGSFAIFKLRKEEEERIASYHPITYRP